MITLLFFFSTFFIGSPTRAAAPTVRRKAPDAAEALRKKIEFNPRKHSAPVAYSFRLPISANHAQGNSDLCWVFAFVNALETLHLVSNPGDTSFSLSEHFLQYTTMLDRWERAIQGTEDVIDERGTEIDALALIQKYGISLSPDYAPVDESVDYAELNAEIFAESTPALRTDKMFVLLDQEFKPLPAQTTRLGRRLSPMELGRRAVASPNWIAYAPQTVNQPEGWHQHPDPDARVGTQAYFVKLEVIRRKIRTALSESLPVTFGNGAHDFLIYGADYDADDNAIDYYIKDSATGNYRAAGKPLEKAICDVTLIDRAGP